MHSLYMPLLVFPSRCRELEHENAALVRRFLRLEGLVETARDNRRRLMRKLDSLGDAYREGRTGTSVVQSKTVQN